MRTKIIVIALLAVSAGVFAYTHQHNAAPSDLRDAVADNGEFNTSIPVFEKNSGNTQEPKPVAVGEAAVAKNSYSMLDVFASVDTAEGSLRIILNKPASGTFPASSTKCDSRLAAAMMLLNVESRWPGLLKRTDFKWRQFQEVKRLFAELEKIGEFYYPEMADVPVNGKAVVLYADDSARIGRNVTGLDVFQAVDIAEHSVNGILGNGACKEKLRASMRLLNIELRFPGLLEGKYVFDHPWAQYNGLVENYKKIEEKYEFFY